MVTDFRNSNILRKQASKIIPGGAHTYSKGDDQFPLLSPHSIIKGKGARIVDVDNNNFVDWGMGLSSVLLGHAYEPILEVIRDELENGVNFIRPSHLEAKVANQLCEQIPSAQMVKFGKNGSNATSSAIRLARAYTKKELIFKCKQNPFLSIDDWFICDTLMDSGTLNSDKTKIINFNYNDINDFLDKIQKFQSRGIACVILEPVMSDEPKDGFLETIRDICTKKGIVLIFDEILTGFRVHPKGAQFLYGVTPDLSTFGKAMANGFSASALVGKREIMSLGGLEHKKSRVFLLSSTYGGETHHLRAIQKNIELLNANDFAITKYIYSVGEKLINAFNNYCVKYNIADIAQMSGLSCRPILYFKDNIIKTIFLQEMIKYGVLISSVCPSFSHKESEINQTIKAFDKTLQTISKAYLSNNLKTLMIGNEVKPVFRKTN